tara:strand:+ start:2361 stop:2585 length:225 start_codon:yes stop_codon:yes gene_type:complete
MPTVSQWGAKGLPPMFMGDTEKTSCEIGPRKFSFHSDPEEVVNLSNLLEKPTTFLSRTIFLWRNSAFFFEKMVF